MGIFYCKQLMVRYLDFLFEGFKNSIKTKDLTFCDNFVNISAR